MRLLSTLAFGISLIPIFAAPATAASYRLLFETDADAGSGVEVFTQTYNTFDDLINNNPAVNAFSQLNVNSSYSLAGLAYEFDPTPPVDPVSPVPVPASLPLLALGLLVIGAARRRRHG